ncbi:urease accessory protein UreD [Lutimaribacter marinistellae]|uniref:Urease accessory protein UreD n=1 Tax=Lutimaribacter marinistellae TaxID=1820329 RepID=A0ABV7TKN0_9RHOB
MFPRRDTDALQAVTVNTAGGITAGDRFTLDSRAEQGAALTLTTQAAERAYRATGTEAGRLDTQLSAGPNARLTWLPQETILFEGCNLRRRLHVDLAETAQLLLCEPLVFGRAAMGESLRAARFDDRITVTRAGAPLFLDAMRLDGDIAAHLARPFTGAGAGALATLLLVRPDAEGQLAPIRAMLPDTGGASLLAPDVLLLRLLAYDGFDLRRSLVPVLRRLLDSDLPRPWMI